MNAPVDVDGRTARTVGNRNRLAVADCDIHPTVNSYRDLYPYLPRRWQTHLETYGAKVRHGYQRGAAYPKGRSEEHTSELQSLMRISYAVFCLKKKSNLNDAQHSTHTRHEIQH